MKAWTVWDKEAVEPAVTIVFAETRSQAKALARRTDTCESAEFTDIRVHREPRADKLYKGSYEIDWMDDETRLALVRDLEWSCAETSRECFDCVAKEFCGLYENMMDELSEDGE